MGFLRRIGCGAALVGSLLTAACGQPPAAPEAAWSPDTAELVFMSNHEGNSEIYLRPAAGADWVNLTRHPAADNWPEFSPDGRHIAFQSDRSGNLDIWMMEADGSKAVQLTDDPAPDYLPAFSPDGRRITFASWRSEPGDGEPAVHTYVMNADGSEQRRLIADSPGTSAGAVWSPDGRRLLLGRKTRPQGTDLYLADTSGNVLRRLTDDDAFNGAPAFSPDGAQIAFYADRGEVSEIVVMDADGSNRRVVVGGGQSWYPRFSPDGRWLVYTAAGPEGVAGDLDVLAVPVDGGADPVPLAAGPGRQAEGRWRPQP